MGEIFVGSYVLRAKDTGKCLRCLTDDEEAQLEPKLQQETDEATGEKLHSRLMGFVGDEAVSPLGKLELVPATKDSDLVHIRSCYNNKFLRRRCPEADWIVAGNKNQEEDKSSWRCTLFRPVLIPSVGPKTIRLVHDQLGYYLSRSTDTTSSYVNCLAAKPAPDDQSPPPPTFEFIRWGEIVVLPKYVAFKGRNGYFLATKSFDDHPYLQFSSGDLGDPSTCYQVLDTSDGNVRIKSEGNGKFWRRPSNGWIWADASGHDHHQAGGAADGTYFKPFVRGDKLVSLQNIGSYMFCRRMTAEGKTDCLDASTPTATAAETELEVTEQVVSRAMYNFNFRLSDARVYDEAPYSMAEDEVANGSEDEMKMQLRFVYKIVTTGTFKNSTSLKFGWSVKFESGIPYVVNGEVEHTGELGGTFEFEEKKVTTTEVECKVEVAVPKRSGVKGKCMATKGKFEVPYSYTQHDVLYNGEEETYVMEDGLYVGSAVYNFHFEFHPYEL